jgi:excinuclease ABC subunit C
MEENLKKQIEKLPQKPGIYFFKNVDETVIYVGKAKNIQKRVKNHFQKPDQHAFDFIGSIVDLDFILTAGEKDALLLEQQYIKKLQPRWNVEWKDDKNYFSVALSGEKIPRVFITHQPNLVNKSGEVKPHQTSVGQTFPESEYFGPFVSGRELKSFLKEIRKCLPYRSCHNLPREACFYESLGLCAAPCIKKNAKTYFSLVATLAVMLKIYRGDDLRLECYDISNLSGTLAVGSMVVFQNGKADKNSYRKFKIKTVAGQNDVASLKEVLSRRLEHAEWPLPDLIILDGGKGQLNAARGIGIPVLALAKIGQNDGKLFTPFSKNYSQLSKLPKNVCDIFLQIRNEAHRFAIGYNKQRRASLIK